MAQALTAKPLLEYDEPGKDSYYEIQWTIPCWREVRKSESLVNSQKIVFETGSPSVRVKTKWLVGLKVSVVVSDYYEDEKKVRVYWKLLEINGSESDKVEAKLWTSLVNTGIGTYKYTDEKIQEVSIYDIVEETSEGLHFKPESSSTDRDVISNRGNVRFLLKLKLKTPPMTFSEYDCYKMDKFALKSKEQLRQDQVALLNDHSGNADLKILTSDEVEIPVHQTILKARCPVFATMLNCDLSEKTTGIIEMSDITSKTMKIILHYFYVGELLPSWRDPDTIVEFTYAAGKYQMTEVLELLDDLLGRKDAYDVDHSDVQLINLAGKLKLEKAEERLLEVIVKRIKIYAQYRTSVNDIFTLFGFEVEEKAELADVELGESMTLKTMDYLYGNNDSSEEGVNKGMILLAKAQKDGLKKFEKNLLQCIVERAGFVKNAERLFELFGRGKQMGNRD